LTVDGECLTVSVIVDDGFPRECSLPPETVSGVPETKTQPTTSSEIVSAS